MSSFIYLWVCNIVEALKLQSSIFIAMRLRSFRATHFDNETDKYTDNDNPELRENCYSFMKNIRGTQAYWNSVKIHLFAMLRTLAKI